MVNTSCTGLSLVVAVLTLVEPSACYQLVDSVALGFDTSDHSCTGLTVIIVFALVSYDRHPLHWSFPSGYSCTGLSFDYCVLLVFHWWILLP
jgi:hypothetical protein